MSAMLSFFINRVGRSAELALTIAESGNLQSVTIVFSVEDARVVAAEFTAAAASLEAALLAERAASEPPSSEDGN